MPKASPQHPTPTPALRLIRRFGVARLAEWSGRHPSRVYSWCWPPKRNGTGGVVPHRLRQAIVDGAQRDCGVCLSSLEFEPMSGERYVFGEAA
ncbi:MAG TPA: hypothetical protein VFC47_11385 [Caulobacteraceae bacterium]|nr:hypothetical protein [Caulobacteraceae bacterium]